MSKRQPPIRTLCRQNGYAAKASTPTEPPTISDTSDRHTHAESLIGPSGNADDYHSKRRVSFARGARRSSGWPDGHHGREIAMSIRQWMLVKNGQTYIMRWVAGDEGRLLAEMADQIAAGKLPINEDDLVELIDMIVESMPDGDSARHAMRCFAEDLLTDPDQPPRLHHG